LSAGVYGLAALASTGLPRFLDGKVKAPAGQSIVIAQVLRIPAR
jgi:hypothetical protein